MTPRSRASTLLRAAVLVSTLAAVLSACGKRPPTAHAAPAEVPLTVTTAVVRTAPLKGGLTASGLLVAQYEAAVTTQLNGYRVAKVLVDQGASVAAGQPLATLDDTLLRSQIAQQRAVVAQQAVASERLAAEAQRVAGLDGQGVLPQEQIAERRLSARSGTAAVAAAQAQLDDLLTRERLMTVGAPVAGRVLERTVRPGDVATPSMVMFRLASGGVVELNAEVPEADLARIHAGDRVRVALAGGAAVDGVVRLVSPEVEQATKLGHARVTLPVRADLRPGGYARADFTDSTRQAIVAPESALHFDADGASVMVLGADGRVKRLPIKTGARADGMVELIGGPTPGQRVLLSGGAFVLDGDRVHAVESDGSALR